MATWSESIGGNDTAQNLLPEYQAAFFYNDVKTALAKIDAYVRRDFDETDREEWSAYSYSLAEFMWKHGILTDAVRDRAVEMIDTGFGLDIWEAEGKSALNRRKKILAQLREKLLSPQPPKKKIRFNLHTKPIFQTGDLVALRLKTLGKHHPTTSRLEESRFRGYDGKFIVLRKVGDEVHQYADLEPQLRDYWAKFQLYNAVFDECPTQARLENVPFVPTRDNSVFTSESSLFHFRKRDYRVIGSDLRDLPDFSKTHGLSFLFWGVDKPWGNPESDILNAILTGSILK